MPPDSPRVTFLSLYGYAFLHGTLRPWTHVGTEDWRITIFKIRSHLWSIFNPAFGLSSDIHKRLIEITINSIVKDRIALDRLISASATNRQMKPSSICYSDSSFDVFPKLHLFTHGIFDTHCSDGTELTLSCGFYLLHLKKIILLSS